MYNVIGHMKIMGQKSILMPWKAPIFVLRVDIVKAGYDIDFDISFLISVNTTNTYRACCA